MVIAERAAAPSGPGAVPRRCSAGCGAARRSPRSPPISRCRRGRWWPGRGAGPITQRSGHRRRRAGRPRCGRGAGAEPDHPVDPAAADARSRGRRPRPAPWPRSASGWAPAHADGVDGGQLAGGPQHSSGAIAGCSPNIASWREQRVARYRDRAAGPGSSRVAVRDDHAEAVDAAAQAEHDQHVAAGRGPERGLPHRVAEHRVSPRRPPPPAASRAGTATGQAGGAREVAQQPAGVVLIGSSWSHLSGVMWSGESSRTPASRGNSQPASVCSG